jgi:type IV secretory pathway VirB2 component (pilin)
MYKTRNNNDIDHARLLQWQFWLIVGGVAAVLLPVEAYAALDAVTTILCLIIGLIQANVGKAIATLAVIIIGITAMIGRTSWMQAMVVATGIAVVFGAAGLIATLVGVPCV